MNAMPRCIWIDLDNSPHVPFFRPIIDELQRLGFTVAVTARDAFNVAELVRLHRIEATTIGRHYGKHKAMKLLGLGVRAVQLLPYVASHRPCLALSHGSRSQTLAARLAGVPSMVIADYEHVTHLTKPDSFIYRKSFLQRLATKLGIMVGLAKNNDVYGEYRNIAQSPELHSGRQSRDSAAKICSAEEVSVDMKENVVRSTS